MSIAIPTRAQLSHIKSWYGFRYLLNPEVQGKIFDRLAIGQRYDKDLQVLDLYPGPGVQSGVFYDKFKPSRLAMMESRRYFVKHLEEVYGSSPLQLIQQDPFKWESYTDITDEQKIFVPETVPYQSLNNKFYIMANLTEKKHEGLLMQWLACIGNRNWLFRFGRSSMLVWMPTPVAVKLLAEAGDRTRHKCSLMREAFSETKLAALSDSKDLKKFNKHTLEGFDTVIMSEDDLSAHGSYGISAIEFTPKVHNIDLDNWEYVTKHLMVLHKTPLVDALDSLGHGARDYFMEKVIPEKRYLLEAYPQDFTNDDFVYITDLFNMWPFKPNIYMDFFDHLQEESRE
ncbi:Mitochondrial transcription factor 1 [Nakaseomyces bracarensis]|uniref:rRNA adenine N(6)-methyltransferase n=1 Tax=Nakaseomyces bracarensis TaxID=273131 RepID=A0ABR4NM04_9SACH